MKKFFRSIHLYLSMAAGLVILMSCLTGAILVFEHEITSALYPERFFVAVSGNKLPLSLLTENAQRHLPGSKVASLKVFKDPAKTVEVNLSLTDKTKESKLANKTQQQLQSDNNQNSTAGSRDREDKRVDKKQKKKEERKPAVVAYVNPYSGKIIEVFDKRKSFFFTVEMLHRWLLTGKEGIGKTIVGISTFLFLFILLTGLVLWWPKTKKLLLKRTTYIFTDGWRKLNHDLHIVTGFYLSVFLIIIVLTGLVMSYNWVNKGLFALSASSMENPKPPVSVYHNGKGRVSLDQLHADLTSLHPDLESYNVRMPQDSLATFTVNIRQSGDGEISGSTYYLDQYSGKQLGVQTFDTKNTGQKMRAYVKPIHTGAVFGWPTKLLSLIICLLTLSFPITGTLLWLNRNGFANKKPSGKSQPIPGFTKK